MFHYVRKAKAQGYRSRAAFKLLAERQMIEYRANAGYFVSRGGAASTRSSHVGAHG